VGKAGRDCRVILDVRLRMAAAVILRQSSNWRLSAKRWEMGSVGVHFKALKARDPHPD